PSSLQDQPIPCRFIPATKLWSVAALYSDVRQDYPDNFFHTLLLLASRSCATFRPTRGILFRFLNLAKIGYGETMDLTAHSRVAKKNNLERTCLLLASSIALVLSMAARPSAYVPYPAEYRTWVHVKTAVIGPKSPAFAGSGGIHHVYANAKAMDG